MSKTRPKQKKSQKSKSKPVKLVSDTYVRPTSFPTLVDAITYAKKSVYSITRIRQINGVTNCATIGTGFLVSPNKLMTAAHVFNTIDGSTPTNNPMAFHKDGDNYYLLNKDPYDLDHFYRFNGKKDKNLFFYPSVDAAIIYVNDEFYNNGRKILQHKDVFLKLSDGQHPLGTKVMVLGYPVENGPEGNRGIYIEQGSDKLSDELMTKRVDRGVINARYTDPADRAIKYDFTMAFNPGNSGGPIVDEDGLVVAVVHGFKWFPSHVYKETYTEMMPDGQTRYETQMETIRAMYSTGFAADNFATIINDHDLTKD